ncbi:hypothetical protein HN748_03850 [Candidatus Peregrinibacteria bacterium]|mgnify:CR=1 FL=1|jgi:hypothetical protein|nr:hypothetical protein [Candidatus Peregrinibacteria bacterium]MBT7483565.1 hypothetical protein [Candidatus Peregrinibacteria bacterium]MBT7703343.1 hypothetical protein [Candidatus Peregrinibacteria bacterium]
MNLEKRIAALEERNHRVEADKAWETSFFRRVMILTFTYVLAFLFMWVVDLEKAWLGAFVPTFGYLLSTFSLPPLKNWWTKRN